MRRRLLRSRQKQKMDAITENVENCSIHVDSATQRGSVIDVVRIVLGCTASAGYSYYTRLIQEDVAQHEVGTVSSNLGVLFITKKTFFWDDPIIATGDFFYRPRTK